MKNWVLSVDQCQLQALQFSVHLIDLLSILLRCNDFTRIQRAVVEDRQSRLAADPQTVTMTFFGASLALGRALELLLQLSLLYKNPLSITHHNPIENWLVIVA